MPEESTSLIDTNTVAEGHWSRDHEFGEGVGGQMGKFESVSALGDSYAELQKLQGTMISPPKEGDTPEQTAEKLGKIYTQLGRPETVEGYELTTPETMPKGLTLSDENVAGYKKLSLELGLNKDAFNRLAKFQFDIQAASVKSQALAAQAAKADVEAAELKQKADAIDVLKAEWGNSGFDTNIANNNKAILRLGGEELRQLFKDAGIANSPVLHKALHKIHDAAFSEDALVSGDGQANEPGGGLTDDFYNNPEKKG